MAKAKTKTALDNEVRVANVEKIVSLLYDAGEDVMLVKSNVIAFPVVDSEKNESWVEITVKVPKGERLVGGGYAGYNVDELDEMYQED